jgi:hypothetical protein
MTLFPELQVTDDEQIWQNSFPEKQQQKIQKKL